MPGNRFILRRPFPYTFRRYALFLILVNFIIFSIRFVDKDLSELITIIGSMSPKNVVENKAYWQFFSYMFIHKDVHHIVFNMIALLVFGLGLEKAVGSREFLLFYIICGAASGFLSFLVYLYFGQNVYLMGASGAIYAVLFAYAVFFPRSVIFIWGIIPVPAPVMVFIYALIELGSQLFGSGSNVAHMTHLFGFFAAWLYFVIRMGIHPVKIWKETYRK